MGAARDFECLEDSKFRVVSAEQGVREFFNVNEMVLFCRNHSAIVIVMKSETKTGWLIAATALAQLFAAFVHGADPVEALKAKAEKGDARAQFSLGVRYSLGDGVAKDEAEAVKWYRKAADQGDAFGQGNLGVMYADGRGVAKDEAEAVKWYRKAADQGNALAQFNLGVMYEDGLGVAKDESEAVKWYRKAAEQGEAMAQGNLGTEWRP